MPTYCCKIKNVDWTCTVEAKTLELKRSDAVWCVLDKTRPLEYLAAFDVCWFAAVYVAGDRPLAEIRAFLKSIGSIPIGPTHVFCAPPLNQLTCQTVQEFFVAMDWTASHPKDSSLILYAPFTVCGLKVTDNCVIFPNATSTPNSSTPTVMVDINKDKKTSDQTEKKDTTKLTVVPSTLASAVATVSTTVSCIFNSTDVQCATAVNRDCYVRDQLPNIARFYQPADWV